MISLKSTLLIKVYNLLFFCMILLPVLSSAQTNNSRQWWKEAIIYQIYPRSFKDSNGDGVGDLKGIISKLDYIQSLGVTAIWLNPIYSSPNDDNGYDISDYRNIMKDFGTMQDFDLMLKEMHKRNIKLIMDLVVNHSSDEHEWFKQSRSSRNNPYRDYYHWWPAENGKPTPRWSFFDVNSDAWMYDATTNAYYLHYFSRKQPDLNWENPKVRQEVYDIMKFWINKGIDGFRMDAFQFVSKDITWPAFPKGYEKNIVKYYGMGPQLHTYLKEMNREVMSKYKVMTVAEGAGSTLKDAHDLVDHDRHELNMAFHFEVMDLNNNGKGYSLLKMKKIFTKWDSAFARKGWVSIFLANHDNPRMVSKFGNDSPQFRAVSSKMLTTLIMTMRGTPYYYNGDELGMANIKFDKIEDYRDLATLNAYKNLVNKHGDLAGYLKGQAATSRDNGRTPFQWNGSANAGFSTATPWLKVNPDYKTINAEAELKDPNSILNYFKQVVALRKSTLALVYGRYKLLDAANPDVFSYTREFNGEKYLILLNFKTTNAVAAPGLSLTHNQLMINNYTAPPKMGNNNNTIVLQPYQAVVYKL
ncbi:oligo-1,6-glucosidase [Mucilaginibacter gracilis]|uniref:Oligo-1,6-glucosidase n=1 Tax=Mucilaginibacter gracilis TaxID=423350 RepID=A0A495IY50_9SPHI|nr:alpha-glucosidase [Mucilaginibacter gracilis]RKR80779.1 oligo-1,6-glucosidase [Mucilaginibacter gracilis]